MLSKQSGKNSIFLWRPICRELFENWPKITNVTICTADCLEDQREKLSQLMAKYPGICLQLCYCRKWDNTKSWADTWATLFYFSPFKTHFIRLSSSMSFLVENILEIDYRAWRLAANDWLRFTQLNPLPSNVDLHQPVADGGWNKVNAVMSSQYKQD